MNNTVSEFFVVMKRNKKALAGTIILLCFLLMAIIGPIVIELDTATNYAERLQGPSFKHILGTDYAGRDTFAILIHGSRDVLLIALFTGIFTILIAFLIGTISGMLGGIVDMILDFIINVMLTVPSFPIMMILSMIIKIKDPITFSIVLSIWSWAGLARAIRSQILSLKQRDFIEASRVLGLGVFHMLFAEMLPNIASYVAINFIMIMRGAITASVGLMMLGLVPFSSTNWGMMLNLAMSQTGALYAPNAIFYFLAPVLAIMFFQIGCLFFANGLDEALNPRLRTQ